ncbi:MAG TPA: enolase C-terminal domain-like protein [Longimicrobiales bacterium]|nr:enolase C-terminal domain-like protein [Longimicrobiales bacterium]
MPAIERVDVSAYTIPTDAPESDGTLRWDSTTLVLVEASADGVTGIGYSYAHEAAAVVVERLLAHVVTGMGTLSIPGAWSAMVRAVRNAGRPGIAATAISAVDVALWDLKARLLELPLCDLLGRARDAVPVYGSGGFTSYDAARLRAQLEGWVGSGITRVKMKVGRDPVADVERVRVARDAIGSSAELYVDANGAYDRKQALALAGEFREYGVTWFEEPVSSDDLDGLRLIRDRAPAGMEIAAGEYGYDPSYFGRMLEAGAVDVLQADATRCLGITGFMDVAALCRAFHVPLSSHTAPSLHLHVGVATDVVRHLEYFHDHARIEQMLFDGAVVPEHGEFRPDLSRPGLGLELRRTDAERFRSR